MKKFKYGLLLLFVMLSAFQIFSQDTITNSLPFFKPSPVFNQKRFNYALGFSVVSYAGFSYGLYNSWYKGFDRTKFHLFDDFGEWQNMDKGGHIFSGYFQSHLTYQGAKWTGLPENKCINAGVISGFLFQSTIEVFDAFNEKWGFSLSDMGANLVGLSTFYFQQKYWGEQRITLKESSWPVAYSDTKIYSTDGLKFTTEKERAHDLFGSDWGAQLLKDYNVQTYWASINIASFTKNACPKWLNVAVGYGAGNLFGGYKNEWENDGFFYQYNKERFSQYYIALDYDLRKIKVKNHFLSSVFKVLDLYKWPAPAIEYNTLEGWKFHLMLVR